jgi:hypothetical protein
MSYPNYAFGLGLIDSHQRDLGVQMAKEFNTLVENGKWEAAANQSSVVEMFVLHAAGGVGKQECVCVDATCVCSTDRYSNIQSIINVCIYRYR